MAKYKIACLSVFAPEVLAVMESVLPEGFDFQAIKTYDVQERLDVVTGADFILAGDSPIDSKTLDMAPNVRLIQKWGIGIDRIDLKAVADRGIPVAITAGANAIPVAELTVLLMLAVYRRLPYVDRSMREGRWVKSEMRPIARQLNDKTVGLIGLGNIGREVAKRVQAFNARVVYYDAAPTTPETEEQLDVHYLPLDDLLAQADIVSVHVPLTPSTRHLIDARALSLMKPTAVVINTARGGIIDEAALVQALQLGRIMGAGIDVFVAEPPPSDHPLFAMDNVVVTSHVGGGVLDNVANVTRHAFSNIVRVVNGDPIPEADLIHL